MYMYIYIHIYIHTYKHYKVVSCTSAIQALQPVPTAGAPSGAACSNMKKHWDSCNTDTLGVEVKQKERCLSEKKHKGRGVHVRRWCYHSVLVHYIELCDSDRAQPACQQWIGWEDEPRLRTDGRDTS